MHAIAQSKGVNQGKGRRGGGNAQVIDNHHRRRRHHNHDNKSRKSPPYVSLERPAPAARASKSLICECDKFNDVSSTNLIATGQKRGCVRTKEGEGERENAYLNQNQ